MQRPILAVLLVLAAVAAVANGAACPSTKGEVAHEVSTATTDNSCTCGDTTCDTFDEISLNDDFEWVTTTQAEFCHVDADGAGHCAEWMKCPVGAIAASDPACYCCEAGHLVATHETSGCEHINNGLTTEHCNADGSVEESCSWNDEWFESPNTVLVLCILIAIVTLTLASAVVCCGQMLEQKTPIGAVAVVWGLIAVIVPFMAGGGACTKSVRDECPTALESEQDAVISVCKAGVFFILLFFTGGKVYILLGLSVASLIVGGLALCGCCKANPNAAGAAAPATQGTVVQGAVVQAQVQGAVVQ